MCDACRSDVAARPRSRCIGSSTEGAVGGHNQQLGDLELGHAEASGEELVGIERGEHRQQGGRVGVPSRLPSVEDDPLSLVELSDHDGDLGVDAGQGVHAPNHRAPCCPEVEAGG